MRLLLLDHQAIIKKKINNGGDSESLHQLTYTDNLLSLFSQPAQLEKLKHGTLPETLSERELEVLRFIAAGYTNLEIAEQLVLAHSTVKTHVNNLYGKFGVHSRTQAIAAARELGLFSD